MAMENIESIENQEAEVDMSNIDATQLNTDEMDDEIDGLGDKLTKTLKSRIKVPEGVKTVILNIPEGKVTYVDSEDGSMHIEHNISYPNNQTLKESTIDNLANAGRYNATIKIDLEEDISGSIATIEQANLEKNISVNGVDIDESISYVVHVPAGLTVKTAEKRDDDAEKLENLRIIANQDEKKQKELANK